MKHKMTLIKGKHTLTNIDKVTNVIFSQVCFNTVRLTNTVGHVAPDSRVISRCRCNIWHYLVPDSILQASLLV